MTIEFSTVTFELVNVRGTWKVRVTHPSGRSEHITGFKNRWDAAAWIGSGLELEWLRARGLEIQRFG
jgi:hypothetical protein